jgi:hypothetical protein
MNQSGQIMKPEDLDFETVMATRRKAVSKSIRQISIDELNALLPKLLPDASHPWNELFQQFLNENRGDVFYEAEVGEGAYVVYCRAKEKGIWYIPERGVGLLDAGESAAMKEIVVGLSTPSRHV